MDHGKLQALGALLQCSLDNVVIRDDSRDQSLAVNIYRRNLQRSWRAHDPDWNLLLISHYKPRVEDAILRDELLQVVTAELAPNIHENTIQTAAIAIIGGLAPGYPLDDLMTHILDVAIVLGPLYTAEAFYRSAEAESVSYQSFGLLTGVRVDKELQISQGIRLVPIPNSTSGIPPHIPLWPYMNPIDLLGRTLIVIDNTLSPIFINPRLTQMDPIAPFSHSLTSTEYPDFNIERFCNALSLAGNASIACSASWTHVEPTEIFNIWGKYQGGSHRYIPWLMHRLGRMNVTEDDIARAKSIYLGLQVLQPGVATKLWVPIDRWIKSKADQSIVDTIIDLGIALESLYLEDIGNSAELSFRLRLRAAWYLAPDQAGRQKVMRDLRDLYDLRSKAVHTGDIGSQHDVRALTQRGQELCVQSIVKVIRDGRFPDWNQLVLGGVDQSQDQDPDQCASS